MTRRLLLSYLSITAFVLLIIEIPLGVTFARAERDRLVAAVERDATVLATVVEDTLEAGATSGLDPVAAAYQGRTSGRAVVVDRQGVTVADSDPPAPGRRDLTTRPEIAAALRGQHATGSRSSATLGGSFLYVAVPVASQGRVYGAVRITYPTATVDARVRRVWLALAGVAAVVLGVVALVGLALARSTTRPLRALEQATTAAARGDLAARAPIDRGPPEVRRLAATFNDMAARLSRLLDSQRAFVADASHQLRTPLTALRLRLENLEATMPPAAAGDLGAAAAETGRLARLVDGLLTLARAEADPVRREVVDPAAVMADRQAAWAPLAAEQDVELVVQPGPAAPVWAAPGTLEQVLDNLLANALRVAPAGSQVELAVRQVDGWVELHVTDQGPGMPAEQRQRAFDRFWRGPVTDREGTGLGLAIVRQLLEAGGGTAELRPNPGGGLDAVARLRPANHATLAPSVQPTGAATSRHVDH
ncbi:MAG TPA: ATP-binding protein [Actinomycetota bacterium]|jgi:signal transduction histidine kinase|nr:ATP-binding protein [Actinomycetota bacterium]